MANNEFMVKLSALLDKQKSKSQINSDIKQLESVIRKIKLTGTLVKGSTKTELNAVIKQMEAQLKQIKLSAKLDSRQLNREINTVLRNVSARDIQINLNSGRFNMQLRRLISEGRSLVERNPISVNIDLKKDKLQNHLTKFIRENTKINESSHWLQEADRLRSVIGSITNRTDLRRATDQLGVFTSGVRATGYATISTTDRIKGMLGQVLKIGNYFGLMYVAINKYRQSLNNLKEIDTILTEISKTTDINVQNLQKLGDEAYSISSKFGVLAKNYLTSMQEMSRAGFGKGKAEPLAELATLAQSAGALTSELANDYLIASNAAYGYQGNVEKLNGLLDSQNQVTNRNAVSMTELADATKVAANQLSNAAISEQEMTSLLGTGISTTKETGQVVGRAVKAIVMNLQQVKNADEGLETTEEDLGKVESRLDSLGIKMKETSDGIVRLRNPITILQELAKTYNELPKDSAERANIISDIGGKYRGNVLSSILSNWTTYEKMFADYENASGSALREAEKSADSWQGRCNQLQNSWDSFVNSLTSKNTIKGGISFLDNTIQSFEKLTDLIGAIPLILTTVNTSMAALNKNYGITQLRNAETGRMDIQGSFMGMDITAFKAQKKHFMEAADAMELWNNKLLTGTANIRTFSGATGRNNAQLRAYLRTCSVDAPATLAGYKSYLNAAGVSTDALRLKTVLLTSAMSLGIGLAIQLAVSGIAKLIQSQEEARQAAQDSANTYKESTSSLEEYTKQYQELHTALLKAKGNEEETYNVKKQLLELQTELNDKYGDEYGKINLVTDAYKDQTDAIKALNKENANEFLNKNESQIDKAEDEITKKRGYNLSGTGMSEYTDANKELLDIVKKYENQGIDTLEDTDGSFSIHLNADATNAEDIIQSFMTDIRTKAKELGDEHLFDDVLKMSSSSLADAQGTMEKYGEIYSQALFAQISADPTGKMQEGYDKVAKAVEAYNEAVLKSDNAYNDENVKKAYQDYENIKSDILNDEDWNKFSYIMENIWDSVNTKVFELKEAINSDQEGMGKFVDKLKGYNDVDLQAIADSKDSDIFDSLSKYAEEYNVSIVELIDNLVKLGYVQGEISNTPNNANNSLSQIDTSFSISEEQTQEIDTFQSKITNLQSVLEKLNTGTLTDSEMVDFIQEFPELADKTDDLSASILTLSTDLESNLISLLGSNAPVTLINSIKQIVEKLYAVPQNIDTSSIPSLIDQLNTQLKPAFDSLKSSYEAIFTEDGFTLENIDFSAISTIKTQIDELNKTLGVNIDYKSYENLVRVLTDSSSTAEDAHKAFDALANDFLYNSNLLENVTQETSSVTIAMLESIGITNAKTIVEEALTRAEHDRILAEQFLEMTGKNLFDVTANEIAIMVHQGKITSDVAEQMSLLAFKKQWVNRNAITTSGDIKNMADLASASSKLSQLLTALANAKAAAATGPKAALVFEGTINDLEKQINDFVNGNYGNNTNTGGYTPPSYSPPANNTGKDNKEKAKAKEEKTQINWIERKLEVLGKQYEVIKKKASDILQNHKDQNKELNEAIKNTKRQIEVEKKSQEVYKKKMNQIKLSSKTKEKIENGSIDITDYSKKSADKISKYQDYYDKIKESKEQILDLDKQLSEDRDQKIDNISDDAEKRINLIESRIALRQTKANGNEKKSDYKYYISQTALEKKKLKEEKEEINQLLKQRNLSKDSDDYYEYQERLKEIEEQIVDCDNNTKDWNKSIAELDLSKYDSLIGRLNDIQDELSDTASILSGDNFDENGILTDIGLANLTINYQGITSATSEVNKYNGLIATLNKQYKEGIWNQTEYNVKLEEYTSAQRDASLQLKGYKDAVLDFKKNAIQEEINAFEESISTQKDLLKTKKDLHDYEKSIEDDKKNIVSIQKQITALEGDESLENQKKLRDLKAKLKDAEESLKEKEYDHDIEQQEKALDKTLENYKETKEKELSNLENNLDSQEKVLNEYLKIVQSNYNSSMGTINKFATEYGMDLTNILKSPWQEAIKGANTYKDVLKNSNFNLTNSNSTLSSGTFLDNGLSTGIDTALYGNKPNTQAILQILRNGTSKEDVTDKTSELNQYVNSNYGSRLGKDDMVRLASLLGLKDVTKESISDNDKQKKSILKSLKNAGFAHGGIIEKDIQNAVHANGDSSLASVNVGETVLTDKFTNVLPFATDTMDELVEYFKNNPITLAKPKSFRNIDLDALAELAPMPNFTFAQNDSIQQIPSKSEQAQNVIQNPVANIYIDGADIKDYEGFRRKFLNDSKTQRAIQEITWSEPLGKGDPHVNKYV